MRYVDYHRERHIVVDEPSNKKQLMQLADLTTMGWAMVLSIVLGLALGWFLDKKFSTEPIFTLLLLFLGILSGFRIMYKTYKRFFDEEKQHDSDKHS